MVASAFTSSAVTGVARVASGCAVVLPLGRIATVVIGGVVAVKAVPMVLGVMGFTATGITSSSIAAKMMSAAAIANGGGVAPGSLVATLQSLGATGLSGLTRFILGSTGSAIAAGIARFY
ncbi:PREDICTED: interferon alpha-inducible protein 27, mitochondrial isoform X1 [Mandrillus leucophaeus]|uniref:Interferon alpha inducible protein 27 n=1 Tax=Mandrillus leucophaeus TaxID=9568 RepID=A0A2K5ZF04_MANLE|nr:PREDICTED: interferon alpha-inducible protein 27, mitochondrial isoform X1 [Mandrillus leucophaeus]XP_011847105.1 PREDICTED: interferon alpha-inducible protein 27, mitochondrial isoform X1 [Mandrillus leucophaeus]XP_011847106.1 PREDICTED: interferon alpha-inducible protein 27, mitochondrial isoform X1 [Mandrillus leucophaeus]